MNLKSALLSTVTAGACLLVAGCGGGGTDSDSGAVTRSGSNNSNGSGTSAQYVAIDLTSSAYAYAVGFAVGDGEQAGEGILDSRSSPCFGNDKRALLWRGSPSNVVDLHPSGFCGSMALATSGGIQVGSGQTSTGAWHALKWAGSASSVVDLDPTGLRRSEARGISGDQVVGFADMPDGFRAFLWTSRSVVDLHPSGFRSSLAYATDGAQQVGIGDLIAGNRHALLWSGSANSVVDLHPGSEECFSEAHGVSDGQQVGYVRCGAAGRAALWTGSAESVIDLHPRGFDTSQASAVAAGRQVGYGSTSRQFEGYGSTLVHALLWSGTADSVVDLHTFLPAGFRNSLAHGIDASGNIIGQADGHAILWVRQ